MLKHFFKLMTVAGTATLFSFGVAADEQAAQQLQQKLSGLDHYQAAFKQSVTDAQGELVHEASGTLTLMRPDKLRWEVVSPDPSLLIADGEAVWNIDPFVEQVTIISQTQAVADNPVVLLTTQDAAQWQKYEVTALDKTATTFLVKPVNGQGQIQALSLKFTDGVLSSLTMQDAQEQQSALTLSEINSEFTPQTGTFAPQVPANYIVDDQR